MNLNLRIYSIVYFLTLIFCIVGCKKFVEIPPPVTQLVTANVFDNSSSATAALTMIYTQMQTLNESYNISQANGLLSDELKNYSTAPFLVQYYTNSMLAVSNLGCWNDAYNYIYQADAIISALQNNAAINQAINQQLIGESKFIRAFWYFYLTNLYGDVPLVTSIDYTINATLSKSPKLKVYDQIISDLKDAQALLNSNYVDGSDTAITTERVRPTKWAADALLARVYLFAPNPDYFNAEVQATAVINNTNFYSLPSDLNQVFLANSSEAIWQLMTPLPTSNGATPDGQDYILISQPGSGVSNCNAISPQLLNSFEPGDNRLTKWIGSYTDPTSPFTKFYFPYKYKIYDSSVVTEYVMVLRLAEQYLIRAEARAMQNNLNGAIQDLNIIRNRAGLNNTSSITQSDILTAILHERQTELFTEWGNRWLDLIRTGNVNAVMGTVTPLKGGVWTSTGQVYPIPQSELGADPNLSQNQGY
jgi:starch-binding outer membrane protein, SusD/RagB family